MLPNETTPHRTLDENLTNQVPSDDWFILTRTLNLKQAALKIDQCCIDFILALHTWTEWQNERGCSIARFVTLGKILVL
jgi:hypothetical protein